jgi:signal transduction histidine kinase
MSIEMDIDKDLINTNIKTDINKLKQVLLNLLTNAIKFNKPN